jgi:imidazolonepropionase-like amidohydrolase
VEAGVSSRDALLSATRNAAEALGRSDDLGTVEPGKWADLVAVQGDPLEDITILQDVGFVMKEGVVHKLDGDPVR